MIPVEPDGSLGPPTDLVERAHAAGLLVHIWTIRTEQEFLPPATRATPSGVPAVRQLGVDGVFTDFPDWAGRRRIGNSGAREVQVRPDVASVVFRPSRNGSRSRPLGRRPRAHQLAAAPLTRLDLDRLTQRILHGAQPTRTVPPKAWRTSRATSSHISRQ